MICGGVLMNVLMEKIILLLVLALRRSQGTYTVDTDACAGQMRCLLFQRPPKRNDKPMRNWSHSLTDVERA